MGRSHHRRSGVAAEETLRPKNSRLLVLREAVLRKSLLQMRRQIGRLQVSRRKVQFGLLETGWRVLIRRDTVAVDELTLAGVEAREGLLTRVQKLSTF